ncbi:hypothetical protein [Fusobacterium sp.]|nr:hypothetical protein [Fusobacterium sp.]
MEHYGIIPKRGIGIKIGAISLGLYSIYTSILNINLFYILFGIILIFATFCRKKHILTADGVDIYYSICGFRFHNIWKWSEIRSVHLDYKNSKPNVEFHISKGIVSRRFIFQNLNICEIIEVIKKANSKIYISEIERK